jgi:structure-specific recognition protein 1
MRGNKYDYRIRYDDISRLFLLPKPDDVHMAFVIALDKPIRQGQQRYQYLVLQTNKDPDEVHVNLDEETIKKEYGDDLQPIMKGSFSNLVAKTFKVISKKKVFIPGKFANANAQPCVKCALRANEGLLYPLEKQFVFIHKPPVLIRFNEVESVEFERYAGGQGSTRNFDLRVTLKEIATGGSGQQEYTFSGIDRSDYGSLYNFLSGKNLRIKNLQETAEPVGAPVYNEDEIYGGPDDEGMEEESEDEDYDEKAAAADQQAIAENSDSEADSEDDEDFGSEVDDDLDSDLEEARGGEKKRGDDSDDDLDDHDIVIDDLSSKKKKKRKTSTGGSDSPIKGKKKAKKDPKAPKKALNAYMIYAQEHRERIKNENPDAKVTEISKLIGEAYKNLGSDEKAALDKKVAADKERYVKEMKDYTPSAEFAVAAMETGKKKKAKKDPNAPKGAKGAYMFFSTENREKLKKENPDMSFGDLGKALGEQWKMISADEKAKYEEMAKNDKERHKKEMSEYTAKQKADEKKAEAADSDGMDDDDDDDESLNADSDDDDLHMS